MPTAFRLRVELTPPEPSLSVSWVEHVEAADSVQIARTGALLAEQVNAKPTSGGAFAIGNVGEIIKTGVDTSGLQISILSTPKKNAPAYAQVWGIPHDDLNLQTALAFGCWGQLVKAAEILTQD
ncbi:MAG: hypothetical protein K9G59_04100 [Caulobacter sp.]|nr:hypothetical protein [Caulobacter sp.]